MGIGTVDRLQLVESLLDGGGEAVLAVAPDGSVRYASSAAGALLGWSPAGIEGRPLGGLFSRDGERVAGLVPRTIRDGASSLDLAFPSAPGGLRLLATRVDLPGNEPFVRIRILGEARPAGTPVASPVTWMEGIREPLLVLDRAGTCLLHNRAAASWRRPDGSPSLVGSAIWVAHPDLAGGAFEREIAGAVAGARPARFEFADPRGDAWWDVDASPAGGGLVVLVRDVTARIASENRLRESEERARALADATFEGVAIHEGGRILEANGAFERIFGRSREELLGMTAFDLIDPLSRGVVAEHLRTRAEDAYEIVGRRKDGSAFPVEVAAKDCRYLGRPARVVAVRDVTARKVAEHALQESEERFRSLIENVSDVVTILEPDGTVRYASPSLERVLGLRPAEVVGLNGLDVIHPEDGMDVLRTFSATAPGEVLRAGFRIRHRDGSWRHLEAVGANLLGKPEVRGFIVAGRDVTQRRRLEQEADAQREAFSRNERLSALGTLVAGVAHEINNPLAYLCGNLELALLDLAEAEAAGPGAPPPDFSVTRKALVDALEGGQRIAQITTALKAVARQGQGERRRFALTDVVQSVASLVRVGVPREVNVHFGAVDPALEVHGSASELHQVLLNLVKNAVEAIGARPGTVTVVCERDGGEAELRVVDDGPGIPADVRSRIFNPFFTTKASGTGLGLSIVHRIVKDHGGSIVVTDAPGSGATFVVRLPLAEGSAVPGGDLAQARRSKGT